MNFTWANQLAKSALRTAQKRIDSVLDITTEEESDDNDVHVNVSSHSRFDALPEEEEEAEGAEESEKGKWDVHNLSQLYSPFAEVPEERETEDGNNGEGAICSSPSHDWGSQWTQQEVGIVDSEPNPIRDSHHPESYQHSPSSNSPDEVCSGDDHDATHSGDNRKDTIVVTSEAVVLEIEDRKKPTTSEDTSSQNQHHDDSLTIASSDIEVLRQGDSWSVMSVASSVLNAAPKETPSLSVSESISLEPHPQQAENISTRSSNTQRMEAEIVQLRSHIQHQERRICDLVAQNQKLERKSHDILALKAARNKQSSTEAKLMKKLSEKEAELASLLQEGEKLAETNGKLTKELKRLRANLAEQEQLAKKGAQAEVDRDLANEQLRGLNAENSKLRATIKSMEADTSKVKAADEILANDLKRRDEKIERLVIELQNAEADKSIANEEIKRLQSVIEQISNEADQREISSKGIEEITRGLNAAIDEERKKNELQANYIESLEKRLAEMMEMQRDAAQMVAMANSPLLESIRQLEANAASKEITYETALNEKDSFITALTKANDGLTQENKELLAEIAKMRSGNEEASHAVIELSEKLRQIESENRNLRSNSERNERLLEGLKASLSGKEIEIDKLYVRLRQEAENAERQRVEEQQQIEKLTSRCAELDREVTALRRKEVEERHERKRSDVERKLSLNVTTSNVEQRLPYISPVAAQTELVEVMTKYEQSMRQVSSLQARLASVEEESRLLSSLRKEFQDLRMRYESLLEAHGEKIERIEELELDLADVKKLFREQMELLLGKN
uniref:TATA element modulatory factor 1 TATA binding domain-containing protein n=1 Tax=Parascaris univalens TaxID=6257 RepID=A0A915C8L1_PARUN